MITDFFKMKKTCENQLNQRHLWFNKNNITN
jgi:hypothetical protein